MFPRSLLNTKWERRLPYLRRELGDEADEGYSWPIVYRCRNYTCKLELLPNHTHGLYKYLLLTLCSCIKLYVKVKNLLYVYGLAFCHVMCKS